ncbi:ABC transporter substrate-binding protein [Pseudomaricurvus alkylphenolicus]|uniref:ABC transporter substrate-binding protein n=1 Tax=Pseudomaricurvus alkylphenolicus TaxID=1306991 RepID=UPI001422E94F|nr:ABC transporter substrate-binding protein [Pseudomaricurvus alkylphenolicus]NIB43420.1 ABC transporter substrate-binding protein [Pseudomaricurvus alkylphenolicus]
MAQPWIGTTNDGGFSGILYDAMSCLVGSLGFDLRVEDVPIGRLFSNLANGFGDVSVVLLTRDARFTELGKVADILPVDLFEESLVMAMRSEDDYSIGQLARVPIGGANLPVPVRQRLGINSSKFRAYNSEVAIVKSLLRQRIDVAVGLHRTLKYHADRLGVSGSVTIKWLVPESMVFRLAVSKKFQSKHPSVIDSMSRRLQELKQNGEFLAIQRRHLKPEPPTGGYRSGICTKSSSI